jgi:hypothetical protein
VELLFRALLQTKPVTVHIGLKLRAADPGDIVPRFRRPDDQLIDADRLR